MTPTPTDAISAENIGTLLDLLAQHGGEIVCTASLDTNNIEQARASGRMYVDENAIGFVWMPKLDRIPETDEEVEFFEKWFPLDVPMQESLKNPDFLFDEKRIAKAIDRLRELDKEVPSDLKRYWIWFDDEETGKLECEEVENGEWMKADEVVFVISSLRSELDRLKAENEELKRVLENELSLSHDSDTRARVLTALTPSDGKEGTESKEQ